MRTIEILCLFCATFFLAISCLDSDNTIPASGKLISSTLESAIPGLLKQKAQAGTCASGKTCVTPTNVTGKLYYAGIMVGNESGYSLGFIGPLDPSGTAGITDSTTELEDFDLAEEATISGSGMTCCGGSPYPADTDAYVTRIEILFGYVDTVFTVSSGTLSGAHTIRVVYSDITDLGYTKGDMLYKDTDDAFKWCDSTGCSHTTRPTSPYQNSEVVDYAGSEDGMGNQIIPSFAAHVPEADRYLLTQTELLANSWVFTIDFTMTNGIAFAEDPTTLTTTAELVQHFDLSAEPGANVEEGLGFTVTVSAAKTPLSEDTSGAVQQTEEGEEGEEPES